MIVLSGRISRKYERKMETLVGGTVKIFNAESTANGLRALIFLGQLIITNMCRVCQREIVWKNDEWLIFFLIFFCLINSGAWKMG